MWNINLLIYLTVTMFSCVDRCDILSLLNTKRLNLLFLHLNQRLRFTFTLDLLDNANLIHLNLLYFFRYI